MTKTNRDPSKQTDSNHIDKTSKEVSKKDIATNKESLKDSLEKNIILAKKIKSLENAQDIIFEQFKELEFQRRDIEKQQKKLENSSEKYRDRMIELFGKLVDLKKAKKTISLQNEKLELQQKAIEENQKLIEKSSRKFRKRTIELFGKMIDLKKAKKIISLQNRELKKQRLQLRELNASKDMFFSIISHDLRNPIAGFLNLTDELSTNFNMFSEKESKDFINIMNQSSKQLHNLLENLLLWSRSQTGSIEYIPQFFSVRDMVNCALDVLLVNLENKQLKVHVKVDKEIIAFVDENMILTVIRNLVSNAIKFSPPGKSITIKCEQNDTKVMLSVIDNGVGMKKENQEKLFKIDKHLTTRGTSNEKGSGLGLILCKEFVQKNYGEIWVTSEVNKGSSFNFTMPRDNPVK